MSNNSQFSKRKNGKSNNLMSDIISRCEEYALEGILERQMDIPLLIAGVISNSEQMRKHNSIRVAGNVLLAATSQILEDGNPRRALKKIKEACECAGRQSDSSIKIEHCSYKKKDIQVPEGLVEDFYVILR